MCEGRNAEAYRKNRISKVRSVGPPLDVLQLVLEHTLQTDNRGSAPLDITGRM